MVKEQMNLLEGSTAGLHLYVCSQCGDNSASLGFLKSTIRMDAYSNGINGHMSVRKKAFELDDRLKRDVSTKSTYMRHTFNLNIIHSHGAHCAR